WSENASVCAEALWTRPAAQAEPQTRGQVERPPSPLWNERCRRLKASKLGLLGGQHRAAGTAPVPNLDRIFFGVDRHDHQGSLELLAGLLREPERSSQFVKTLLRERNIRDLELSSDSAHSVTPNKRGPNPPASIAPNVTGHLSGTSVAGKRARRFRLAY